MPPLSERRKAETRTEIARAAVRLFTERGVAATSVEGIAAEAGISLRTFWRYPSGQEECVRPLLTTGTDVVARALGEWRPGDDVAARRTGESVADLSTVLAGASGAARARPADGVAAGARRGGVRFRRRARPLHRPARRRSVGGGGATMVDGALRAAVEHHALRAAEGARTGGEGPVEAVREALRTAVRGLRVRSAPYAGA